MRLYFLLITCFVANLALANDPFDKTQRNNSAQGNNTNVVATGQCHQQQEAIFADTPFKELKVVGVLQNKSNWQVLLADGNQQVNVVTLHDFVGAERLQIQTINKQQIELLDWQNGADCSQGKIVLIKF